jgi:uncharacterized protein YukE
MKGEYPVLHRLLSRPLLSPSPGQRGCMSIAFPDPEFHASVAEVRRAADCLTDARSRAVREVSTLMDGWHGWAASEFAEAWSEWLEASAFVVSSLAGLADTMEAFLGDVMTCDAGVASTLDGLTKRLS